MVYVDLNLVRVGIAKTPECRDFTSVQARIHNKSIFDLILFDTHPIDLNDLYNNALPFSLPECLGLIDWSGRIVRDNKRGFIPNDIAPILQRLGLDPNDWIKSIDQMKSNKRIALGSIDALIRYCRQLRQNGLWSMAKSTQPIPT